MPPLSVTLKRRQQVDRLEDAWDSFLDQQREEGDSKLTDTMLFCDDGGVPVHGPILAQVSAIFKEAFLSQGTNYLKFRTVILAGFKVTEIKLLVQFIYAGFVNVESEYEAEVMKYLITYFQIPTRGFITDSNHEPDNGRSVLFYEDPPATTDENEDGLDMAGAGGEVKQNIKEEPQNSNSTPTSGEELMRFREDEPGASSDDNVPLVELRRKQTKVTKTDSPISKDRPTKAQVSDTPKAVAMSSATIQKMQILAARGTSGNAKGKIHCNTMIPTRMMVTPPRELGGNRKPKSKSDRSPLGSSVKSRRSTRRAHQIDDKDESEDEEEEEIDSSSGEVSVSVGSGTEGSGDEDDEEYLPSPPMKLRDRKTGRVTYSKDSEDRQSDSSDSDSAISNRKANARFAHYGNGRKAPRAVSSSSSSKSSVSTPRGSRPGPSSRALPPTFNNVHTNCSDSHGGSGRGRSSSSSSGKRSTTAPASISTSGNPQQEDVFAKPLEEMYEEDVDDEFYQDADRIYELGTKCFVCKKIYKTPLEASYCVTEKHSMLRCYLCYSVAKTTDGLFDHYRRKHQKTARKDTLQCPFFNCQQILTFRSLSTHVMSLHLVKGKESDPKPSSSSSSSSQQQQSKEAGKRSSSSASSRSSSSPSVPATPKKQKLNETDSSNESPKEGELLITKNTGGQQVTVKLNY